MRIEFFLLSCPFGANVSSGFMVTHPASITVASGLLECPRAQWARASEKE